MKRAVLPHLPLVLLIALCLTLPPIAPAQAASTATRSCDEAGLDAALAAGGVNTFACAAPTTITVSATKIVSVDGTVLDGSGRLILSGGGVRQVFKVNEGVAATFANLTIRDGHAPNGGAIQSLGTLRITDVYFLNNAVEGSGGAVVAIGPVFTVSASTFSGNTAAGGSSPMGGAIYISGPTAPEVTNCTFDHNSAERGGAILTSQKTTALTVTASTFSGNTTTDPYGATAIFNTNGTVTLRNTILSTASGRNCNGAITDGGHNLQYGGAPNSCGATVATGDPKLGALGLNGGPTPTLPLLFGSAAVDKIPTAQCLVTADQRGYHRPAFGGLSVACDIGAFELQVGKLFLPLLTR